MIEAAEDTSCTLAVGLVRRFFPANLYVKHVLGGSYSEEPEVLKASCAWQDGDCDLT